MHNWLEMPIGPLHTLSDWQKACTSTRGLPASGLPCKCFAAQHGIGRSSPCVIPACKHWLRHADVDKVDIGPGEVPLDNVINVGNMLVNDELSADTNFGKQVL